MVFGCVVINKRENTIKPFLPSSFLSFISNQNTPITCTLTTILKWKRGSDINLWLQMLFTDMDDTLYPLSIGLNLVCRKNIQGTHKKYYSYNSSFQIMSCDRSTVVNQSCLQIICWNTCILKKVKYQRCVWICIRNMGQLWQD